nr:von Willebrand factor type A domain-containing protein [uncultured Dyadobacter sp.]
MKIKIALCIAFVISAFAFLPDILVTGTVTDMYQNPLAGVKVTARGTKMSTFTAKNGKFSIKVPSFSRSLLFSLTGYKTKEVRVQNASILHVEMLNEVQTLDEVVVIGSEAMHKKTNHNQSQPFSPLPAGMAVMRNETESYRPINENGFQIAGQQPVTTFSVDVDRASYSNVRRFLNMGQIPPADAIRIEEMINYFDYDYAQPAGEHPIAISSEMTDSPWNPGLKLLHIGLQAKTIPQNNLPASNLVFLIDVSGSMMDQNKLPLLKQAFKLLVDQLRPEDKLSIVAYAGAAGVVLPPTSGSNKADIREALEQLQAGGSTAGGEGIQLAYKLAKEHFLPKGNNRVILATDGDFNVGVSSEGELQRLIEEKRKDGVYLSIMGFGMGNYKDSHIETLADKGNGNYAYIDNLQEARKVFVQEFGGTLFSVAKDVKIQIEFNPRHVQAYRLIGYENRALKNEEFHDDKKDAGEMGSGHSVTAIYEIVPAGAKTDYLPRVDALKYQQTNSSAIGNTDEMLTIKIRYKRPDSETSQLFEIPVGNGHQPFDKCSENLRFASAVAEFGLLLRGSEYKGRSTYDDVIRSARAAFGKDDEGYRSEFVRLVRLAQSLDKSRETANKD